MHKLLLVQVFSSEVKRIHGGEGDRAYDFSVQKCYVTTADPIPTDIEMMLPKGAPPYRPGWYLVGAGALTKRAMISNNKARVVIGFEASMPMIPVKEAIDELVALDKAESGKVGSGIDYGKASAAASAASAGALRAAS